MRALASGGAAGIKSVNDSVTSLLGTANTVGSTYTNLLDPAGKNKFDLPPGLVQYAPTGSVASAAPQTVQVVLPSVQFVFDSNGKDVSTSDYTHALRGALTDLSVQILQGVGTTT